MSKKNKKTVIQQLNTPQKQEATNPTENITTNINSSFQVGDFISKYAFVLTILIISVVAFVVYKDFILLKKAFLFKDIGSDTLNTFYPTNFLQAEYIHKHGVPSWSFQYGMGQSVMPFFMSDIFNMIFYIFDTKHYVDLIIVREMLKLFFTAIVFYKYLKVLNCSNPVATYGSIIVSFSGYMVLGGGWYIFSYDIFCIAFMLLALEMAISRSKFMLIPIGVFLIAISQPFNLFLFGVFFLCYLILRSFQNEDVFNYKRFAFLLGKIILFGLVGMLLSMPFFLENFFQMLESPRGSGEASYVNALKTHPILGLATGLEFGTSIMRFFSSDILGTGSAYRGYNNYLEAGIFYIGLPTLLLVPQIFSFLSRNARIAFGVVLAFWLLPIIFPYFRYALWFFVGDYYRTFALIVTIVMAIYGIMALDMILKTKKINWIILLATVVGLIGLTALSYFPDEVSTNKGILTVVRFLLVIYAGLIFSFSKIQNPAFVLAIFLVVLVGEEIYMAKITVNKRDIVSAQEMKEKVGYNDYSLEAVKYIKDREKTPFYRIDKTFGSSPAIHSSLNDAMLMGYYSTTAYSSFNQKYYINYLQSTSAINGKDESVTRWSTGLIPRTILQSLNSVKYILAKTNKNPSWKYSHDSLTTFGDVSVFRHKFILPMGYAYKDYLTRSEFEKMSIDQKDFYLLKSFFVDDADVSLVKSLNRVSPKDSIDLALFSFDVYRNNIENLKKDTLSLTSFEETHIQGKINASNNELLYLSIPYDKGWHVKIDGKEQSFIKVNAGMSGVLLNKGEHTIDMSYQLPYFYKGLMLALVGLLLYGMLFFMRKKFSF